MRVVVNCRESTALQSYSKHLFLPLVRIGSPTLSRTLWQMKTVHRWLYPVEMENGLVFHCVRQVDIRLPRMSICTWRKTQPDGCTRMTQQASWNSTMPMVSSSRL